MPLLPTVTMVIKLAPSVWDNLDVKKDKFYMRMNTFCLLGRINSVPSERVGINYVKLVNTKPKN